MREAPALGHSLLRWAQNHRRRVMWAFARYVCSHFMYGFYHYVNNVCLNYSQITQCLNYAQLSKQQLLTKTSWLRIPKSAALGSYTAHCGNPLSTSKRPFDSNSSSEVRASLLVVWAYLGGWKHSSSSNWSIRVCRAYPLVEIRPAAACRAIRGGSISFKKAAPSPPPSISADTLLVLIAISINSY